jgi:hypothetical protein
MPTAYGAHAAPDPIAANAANPSLGANEKLAAIARTPLKGARRGGMIGAVGIDDDGKGCE